MGYMFGPWQFGPLSYGIKPGDFGMLLAVGFICAFVKILYEGDKRRGNFDIVDGIFTWIWVMSLVSLGVVVHESSHGLAAILTGAGLNRIEVFGISGLTYPQSGVGQVPSMMISLAGPIGHAIFGFLLYSSKISQNKWSGLGLILQFTYIHLYTNHNDFTMAVTTAGMY